LHLPVYREKILSIILQPKRTISKSSKISKPDKREPESCFRTPEDSRCPSCKYKDEISDGIPYYLAKINYPFWEWLDDELKKVDSFLKSEIDFIMKYEFSDVKTYKKILDAIASGHTKLGEIRDHIGAKGTDISPYLRNLIDVELVERKTPLIATMKSRRGRYYISDNFVNFWFQFINPNITFIEEAIFSATEIKAVYNR